MLRPTFLVLFALLFPAAASAVTVVVPDAQPTITAALATGADEIWVRSGDYSENVSLDRDVILRSHPASGPGGIEASPVLIGTLTFATPASSAEILVRGFRVFGDVVFTHGMVPSVTASIEGCRISGAIRQSHSGMIGYVHVRGCIVESGIALNPYTADYSFNTVLAGGIDSNYEGDIRALHNHILGPAVHGLRTNGNDGGGLFQDNTIVGTTDGITIEDPSGFVAQYNAVSDVAQDGLVMTSSSFGAGSFRSNLVVGAGRHGVRLDGLHTAFGNTLIDAGQAGIVTEGNTIVEFNTVTNAGSDGIRLSPTDVTIRANGNAVVGAQGHGITGGEVAQIRGNVTGRNLLDGIRTSGTGAPDVTTNTSYLNGGSGFRLGSSAPGTVANNISHGNMQYGLLWTGGAATLGCNDWFGNVSGALSGIGAGATDLFVNPLFCNLPGDNVFLSGSSPLVGTPCGPIGARAVGCASPLEAGESLVSALRGLATSPNPSAGDIQFSWRGARTPAELEIYDLQGALRWVRRFSPSQTSIVWDGRDGEGRLLPPGVYLTRLRVDGREFGGRVVRTK